MRMHWLLLATVVSLAAGDASRAMDAVKTAKSTFSGRVVGMNSEKVDLELGISGGLAREIPVNQVLTIFYEDEPAELTDAKKDVLRSRYAEAATALEQIKENDSRASRPEIRQDVQFYKALCAAKLAIAGNGKIVDAGRTMNAFAEANPNSYHYFDASKIVGDLLVAVGQYAKAAEYYGRIAKAPWPDYKMRAGVATGQALLAQGKIDEATSAFDKVIATEEENELTQTKRNMAKLGKASALIAAKKPDEAIKIVNNDVLRTANPDDAPLVARAYNVLGTAHRQAGRTKEALLAFLHVDIDQRYSSVPEAHAEALANLADLWEQDHRMDRANRARKILEEQYKESPWARKDRK